MFSFMIMKIIATQSLLEITESKVDIDLYRYKYTTELFTMW